MLVDVVTLAMASCTTVWKKVAVTFHSRCDALTPTSPPRARSGRRSGLASVRIAPTVKLRTISFNVGQRWLAASDPRRSTRVVPDMASKVAVPWPTVVASRGSSSPVAARHSRRTPPPTVSRFAGTKPPWTEIASDTS